MFQAHEALSTVRLPNQHMTCAQRCFTHIRLLSTVRLVRSRSHEVSFRLNVFQNVILFPEKRPQRKNKTFWDVTLRTVYNFADVSEEYT
jgi:hypothetical protein